MIFFSIASSYLVRRQFSRDFYSNTCKNICSIKPKLDTSSITFFFYLIILISLMIRIVFFTFSLTLLNVSSRKQLHLRFITRFKTSEFWCCFSCSVSFLVVWGLWTYNLNICTHSNFFFTFYWRNFAV